MLISFLYKKVKSVLTVVTVSHAKIPSQYQLIPRMYTQTHNQPLAWKCVAFVHKICWNYSCLVILGRAALYG